MFLAILLLKNGIPCRILEKREKPVPDSRSLGIHPPSLALFDKLDIAEPFLNAGIKIKKGMASSGAKILGEIDFSILPDPYNFILACPQFETEGILRNTLNDLDENCLVTNSEFVSHTQYDSSVIISYRDQNNNAHQVKCNILIGCDGKNSKVRQEASIHFSGKRYPDTYIMGDFEDSTEFENDAVVFLPSEGLIECFPLPNGMRRWVVKTDEYIPEPTADLLSEKVKSRTGFELKGSVPAMLSSFGVQHYMAETFVKNRILLAGDSAHVVSPIGGQGMNLGWLGAWNLGKVLIENQTSWYRNSDRLSFLKAYDRSHRKIVKKAARRAEFNMYMGRAYIIPEIRNVIVRILLSRFLHQKGVELFSMQNLK